jgi:hypothetical protein
MQRSQFELVALVAAVAASALALMLPEPYTWVTSISGFAVALILFSYDADGYRPMFQSLAFSGTCGLGVMVASVVYYRWLMGKGEVHMAGGRIETVWLPLTWLGATLAIWAIDRIRMMGRGGRTRDTGPVQRSFIRQYEEPSPAPVASAEPVTVASPVPERPPVIAVPPAPSPLRPAGPPPVAAPAPIAAPPPVAAPARVAAAAPPKKTEIYVALVGEGLNLMRTVRAEQVGRDFYKIVEPMPEGESWEFGPGQVVRVKKRNLSTGKGLVAVEEAPRAQ